MMLNRFKIICWGLVFAFVLGLAPNARGEEAPSPEVADLVKQLQKQMFDLQKTIYDQNEKIKKLEVQKQQVSREVAAPAAGSAEAVPMSDYEYNQRLESALGGANKWLKDLKFNGDVRLRYEAFDFTHGPPTTADNSRNRFRFRLRYGFEKAFNPDMKVGFSMASGGAQSGGVNTDPTSTNQTMDQMFNFKNIYIEKVYASYSPSWARVGPVEDFNITAGKFNNPFEKGSSDMIWDRDVKPEGAAETIKFKILDTQDLDIKGYVTGGQFILDEDNNNSGGDAELFALQMGINPTFYTPMFEKPVDWLSSVSYYEYNNYAKNSNFMIDGTTNLSGASATDQRGNPNLNGGTTLDAVHFNVVEIYNELALPLWKPLRLYHDFAVNPKDGSVPGQITDSNQAWAIGAKLNSIVKKGDWEASYAYKWIGHNAVVGAFNDSDFGDGHSGKRGSVIKLGYALTDNLTLNGAMYLVNDTNAGTERYLDKETRRFQLDLAWKF